MASFTVAAGTTVTARQDMSGADVGTIEAAVLVPPTAAGVLSVSANAQAIRFTGATNGAIINNSGTIEVTGAQAEPRAIRFENAVGATLNASINNLVSTSIIQSIDDAIQIQAGVVTAGTVTVNNTGVISSNVGQAIDFAGGTGTFVTDVFNNSVGVVRALVSDAIRIGGVGDIVNFGAIDGGSAAANTEGADGVQFEDNTSGTVSNFENGFWPSISGDRHGINAGTGSNITVNNGAPVPVPGFWSITGRNGSGIGSDGDATVTNFGIITGGFTAGVDNSGPTPGVPDGTSDGDGDGIDIDGLATIDNHGTIEGTGASGHGSDGLPNTSEGIAAGGGTITNNSGAIIRGLGLGILIDDSSQGNAPFATTIVNDGLIEGTTLIGIRIISNQGDQIRNNGTITGGGGTAIQFGDGGDVLAIDDNSVINGNSDGGAGTNTLSYVLYSSGGVTVDLGTGAATGTGGVSNFQLVVGTDSNDTLSGDGAINLFAGQAGIDTLTGGAGGDSLDGGADADSLNGGADGDKMDGGADADTLDGGTGNDTYFVDNLGDAITEAAGDALDRLHASTTYVLAAAAAVELITTTNSLATTAIDLTGSDTANSIYGNAGDNTLKGAGDNDVLLGVAGDDNLNGGAGDDKLYGGAGQNDMAGGTGSDWYIVDSLTDVITELMGEGTLDRVFTTLNYTLTAGAHVEILATTTIFTGAIDLTGNELANTIYGNGNTNVLGGGGGNDILVGFGGTDTLNGGDGDDRLLGGTENDTLNGDNNNDLLQGEAGDDNLNGGAGIDRLQGGAGQNDLAGGADNDVYLVTSTTDTIVETAGQGALDRAYTSVSFALTAGAQVEFLAADNVGDGGAMDLTGNEFANAIYGNNGANVISGKEGKDTVSGRGGADIFVFDTAPSTATNFDTVTDFNGAQDDIRLVKSAFAALTGAAGTTLSADQFVVGIAALDANDRIIYTNGTLKYDSNGNAVGGVEVIAFLVGIPALSNTDIVLG